MVDYFHERQQQLDELNRKFRNVPASPYKLVLFENNTSIHVATQHGDYTYKAKLICGNYMMLTTVTNFEPYTNPSQLDSNKTCTKCGILAEYQYYLQIT